jgi:hypothetical protein
MVSFLWESCPAALERAALSTANPESQAVSSGQRCKFEDKLTIHFIPCISPHVPHFQRSQATVDLLGQARLIMATSPRSSTLL